MIDQLIANIKKTNAPIVVGLDPMMKFIPEQIKEAAFKEHGETLKGAAEAIWEYNKGIVDAVYDLGGKASDRDVRAVWRGRHDRFSEDRRLL